MGKSNHRTERIALLLCVLTFTVVGALGTTGCATLGYAGATGQVRSASSSAPAEQPLQFRAASEAHSEGVIADNARITAADSSSLGTSSIRSAASGSATGVTVRCVVRARNE